MPLNVAGEGRVEGTGNEYDTKRHRGGTRGGHGERIWHKTSPGRDALYAAGEEFGEVLDVDGLGNGFGEGFETEGAGGDYGLRVVDKEVTDGGLGDLGTVTGVQGETAETASAADALVAFLGGFHQRADLCQNLTRLLVNSTATA